MATRRLTVATIGGVAGDAVLALFRSWRDSPRGPDPGAVDRLCGLLRDKGTLLPIVYFCEWIDRWSMCDLVPGPDAVEGHRFQATCLLPEQAAAWAEQEQQFPEQEWFYVRLREAAHVWGDLAERRMVVVVREVLGGTTTDDEVRASLRIVPDWLTG